MLFSKPTKIAGSIFMSAMLTNVPAVVMAEPGMIPTYVVAAEISRAEALMTVQDFLNRDEVQKLLIEKGVSAEEASSRVASLSEVELRQLSGQISQARAGGDVLVTVLLVVLIIFLIKRL